MLPNAPSSTIASGRRGGANTSSSELVSGRRLHSSLAARAGELSQAVQRLSVMQKVLRREIRKARDRSLVQPRRRRGECSLAREWVTRTFLGTRRLMQAVTQPTTLDEVAVRRGAPIQSSTWLGLSTRRYLMRSWPALAGSHSAHREGERYRLELQPFHAQAGSATAADQVVPRFDPLRPAQLKRELVARSSAKNLRLDEYPAPRAHQSFVRNKPDRRRSICR